MAGLSSVKGLEELRDSILARRDPEKTCITVCIGTGCCAYGANDVFLRLKEEVKNQGLEDKIDIKGTGCHGFCEKGTLVVTKPQEILYQQVTPDNIPEIISETALKGKIIERLLYIDPISEKKIEREPDIPFYKRQSRLIFGPNQEIDPKDIDDYIAFGGYKALGKVLTSLSPEGVIEEVKRADLRGRGGGGFPAGKKWEYCRQAEGRPKYLVCNADEGDPGAYMDRSLLEGNPHSVMEGMLIGAYAIGASEGFVFVRSEYPLAIENLKIAIEQAEDRRLLGKDILGSGLNFRINIVEGAGAFVCGEETALIASIEDKYPIPRARPPFPAESGLWECPTNINNVESWANVPFIINKGPDWYRRIGTEGSKGTKIFSLVGKVKNTGLIEVPMGITLREIIYDIGGGILDGKKFKAIQTGGPSGGCLPDSLLNLKVDFDELTKVGSMMGSGGMIIMDEDSCIIDIAKYFLNFTKEESCGRCISCRDGIEEMHQVLTRISEGNGVDGDIGLLEDLAATVKDFSLCGLGGTAPNPVLTTMRYFRDEYEAHIREKRCPAGVCKELITFLIYEEKCTGCLACLKPCPNQAISGEKKEVHTIDQEKCIKCGVCKDICKFEAVVIH